MWRQIRVYPSYTPLDSLRFANIFAYQREATINTSRPRSRRVFKRAVINIQSPNFPVSEFLRLNPNIRHHNCCKPCHQIGNYKELVNAPSQYKSHITRHCFSNEMQRYTDLVMCFKGCSNIIFVQQNLWGQICIHKGFVASAECLFSGWFIAHFFCRGLFHLHYSVQKDFLPSLCYFMTMLCICFD